VAALSERRRPVVGVGIREEKGKEKGTCRKRIKRREGIWGGGAVGDFVSLFVCFFVGGWLGLVG
jgi:hypothetical protein